MTDLRKAAQQALAYIEEVDYGPYDKWPVITALRAALAEPEQEPYTDDVTRIMREAGMTFHLGLPHTAVIEQMTRVVDLIYAKATIAAAQKFASELAAPTPRKPLKEDEIADLWDGHTVPVFGKTGINPIVFARAIERAHGIGDSNGS